jgi:protein phosphatase
VITCQACGVLNRSSARFCYQCAAPLADARPSPNDTDWLAATLNVTPSSARTEELAAVPPSGAPPRDLRDTPGRSSLQGGSMDQQQPPAAPQQPAPTSPTLIAGRYEVTSRSGDMVDVLDRQPWRRCWSCGSESNEEGELFCTQCGAALEGRTYQGQISAEPPSGLALVPGVKDADARSMLPPIWDQVRDGEQTLTLVAATSRTALTPPLDELDALYIAAGLARLLAALHAEGLALGSVEPSDLEMTAGRLPVLRRVPELHVLGANAAADVGRDLKALAKLLEALTATPRKTRRLSEDSPEAQGEPALQDVLSDLRTGAIAEPAALEARLAELIEDRTAPRPLWVQIGAASDKGMQRELNEDSLLLTELRMVRRDQGQSWGLYIVADGMGGHSAGEVASDLAIRGAFASVQDAYISPTIDGDMLDEEARLKEVVQKAVLQANAYVLREAQNRGNDMGTTITMALVAGDRAVIGNVGDSRTYLWRDGALRRISKDHSLVQRLVDLGQIEPDDVYTHPQRNAVLRSLGDRAEVSVDVFVERLKVGDALLLCSDGQWEMTHDPQMTEILAAKADPQAACEALIAAANKAGGEDNITALLVQFVGYRDQS